MQLHIGLITDANSSLVIIILIIAYLRNKSLSFHFTVDTKSLIISALKINITSEKLVFVFDM